MMLNMQEGIDATTTALDSQGSAMRENYIYMQSIEGRINEFSETLKKVWIDAISTDTIKGVVSLGTSVLQVVDKLINTFGVIPTTIGIATLAIRVFNKELYDGMVKNIPIIGSLNTKLNGMTTSLENAIGDKIINSFINLSNSMKTATAQSAVLKAGNVALSVSLQAVAIASSVAMMALTMGISYLISAGISTIVKFCDNLVTTKEELKELNTELSNNVSQTQKNITSAEQYIAKIQEINNALANTNDIKERQKLMGDLEEAQKGLSQALPESTNDFSSDGSPMATSIELTKEIIQLKKDEMAIDSAKFFEENKNLASEIDSLKSKKKELEQMKLAELKGENSYTKKVLIDRSASGQNLYQDVKTKFNSDDMKKINDEISDTTTKMSQANQMYKVLGTTSNENANKAMSSIKDYTSSLEENRNSADNNGNSQKILADGIDELGNSADSTKQKFKDLSDEISGSTNKIEMIKQAIKEFNESKDGSISTSLEDKIYASGNTELIAMLGDKNTFLEKANQLLGNEYKLREENKKQIITEAQAEVNATNTKANMYGTDVTNKTNAENAKNTSVQNVLNAMSKMTGETVDELGKKYGIDTTNWNNSQNGKPSAIESVLNEMSRLTGESVNSLADKYGIDARNFAKAQNSKMESMREFARGMISASELVGKTMSVGKGSSIMADNFGGVKSTYNPTPSNYNPVGSTYNSDKASASKKEAEDIKRTADRYLELKNNLDLVNDSLETNKTLQEQAHGQAKIDLINKEIDLLKKRAQAEKNLENAYRSRANSIRNMAVSKGANFDSSGNISNYNALLESYRNRYNSNKTDANKKAYEDLKELLDEYNTLVRDSITSSMNDYKKTLNEITNIQNEKAKLIADSESKISDIYKNEVQKRIDEENKAWQKKKELLSKEWTEEDNADTRADLQKELSDIDAQIQQAIVSGDKQLANALRKQYAEKQAELNKVIQDQQREAMTNEIDDKIQANEDKLEELMKPENINKIIQNALETGMLDIMGETIKLADATKDYINDTTIGVTNINLAYKEQIDLLNEAQKAMLGYAQISSNLGLSNVATLNNINRSAIPQSSNINNGRTVSVAFNSPIVQVDNMNGVDDSKLEEYGEQVANTIFKKIESVLP